MQLFTTDRGIGRRAGDNVELLESSFSDLHEVIAAQSLDTLTDAPVLQVVALGELRLLPPVRPERLILVGLNYRSHVAETGAPVPDTPMFSEGPIGEALAASGDTTELPPQAPEQVDYESEIAVVIGAPASGVAAADAWDVIAGVTAANDISARDLQFAGFATGDMTSAKLLPGFKPLGPGLVTTDEATSAPITIGLRLNGEVRQQADSTDMVFSIAELVEAVSATIDLVPGDVILTGSPAGVGFSTGRYLQDGDQVEVVLGHLPPLCTTIALAPAEVDA